MRLAMNSPAQMHTTHISIAGMSAGDPKGLLPGINAAIAQMLADNKVDEFVAKADELGDVAVEVSADAP